MEFEEERHLLVKRLLRYGYIQSDDVVKAMKAVPRHLFVPENRRKSAYVDTPLPIGGGQTISAPHMVGIMVEAAELVPGMSVLEIGGGSGYHAAVMAEMVRPGGRIITVERLPSLAENARCNLEISGHSDTVQVVVSDGSLGYPKEKPYDRIVVTCGAPQVPQPLKDQLKDGGKLLVPVGGMGYQELLRLTRNGDDFTVENLGGCVFVPLIGEHGFPER
ncbi:MAG: protein-L-isoaspartate(D-aspartate) O-methyltransferase [Methanomassiliicoccales archaeon]|nr:protein-L-isoaspartate(D-aspartate) O-methyltransferase [Methanomassiliicoccales archaeon]